jgi:hypothetical protein
MAHSPSVRHRGWRAELCDAVLVNYYYGLVELGPPQPSTGERLGEGGDCIPVEGCERDLPRSLAAAPFQEGLLVKTYLSFLISHFP